MSEDRIPERELLTAAADSLGIVLDAARIDTLSAYLDLLVRWNSVYNLTAIRDRRHMLTHHLIDCLAVVPALERRLAGRTVFRLLDAGSGAGLPGVVLATTMSGSDIHCVDAVGKKSAFVQQCATQLHLGNLRATHARLEELGEGGYDVIATRAFSSLSETVSKTSRLLGDGGFWMAMKAAVADAELNALTSMRIEFHVEHLKLPFLRAERSIVWMNSAAAKSADSGRTHP